MGRIRTVKPELFRHEILFDLEMETGLPIRLAWIGLFTICDREGRFKWRPRMIKSEIMPYDDTFDFSRVLDACGTRGLLVKYDWKETSFSDIEGPFGCIPSFRRHQVINNRESASVLPAIDDSRIIKLNDFSSLPTRQSRVPDVISTPLVHARGEGKGREGKGKEGKGCDGVEIVETTVKAESSLIVTQTSMKTSVSNETGPKTELNRAVWQRYSQLIQGKFHTDPVRNAKINAQIANLTKRIPETEVISLLEFYFRSENPFYVKNYFDIGLLVQDAEKLHLQMKSGVKVQDMRNGLNGTSRVAQIHQSNDDLIARRLGLQGVNHE